MTMAEKTEQAIENVSGSRDVPDSSGNSTRGEHPTRGSKHTVPQRMWTAHSPAAEKD